MDTALALAGSAYRAPAIAIGNSVDQREHVIWWAVVVGFAYALALAYAAYCRHTGGDPEISFGWSGFKVVCKS